MLTNRKCQAWRTCTVSVMLIFSGEIAAQTWNYQTYNGQGRAVAKGYVTLEESGGEHTFRMFAGNVDICYRSSLKAQVESTETALTITPVFPMQGCGETRLVIKKDGSGGFREIKEGDQWKRDDLDRLLTRRP